MEHFVIMAARSNDSFDSAIYSALASIPRRAHEKAADDFRRKRNLPSSTHVHTVTLGRFNTEEEAIYFVDQLIRKMDERKDESVGNVQSISNDSQEKLA